MLAPALAMALPGVTVNAHESSFSVPSVPGETARLLLAMHPVRWLKRALAGLSEPDGPKGSGAAGEFDVLSLLGAWETYWRTVPEGAPMGVVKAEDLDVDFEGVLGELCAGLGLPAPDLAFAPADDDRLDWPLTWECLTTVNRWVEANPVCQELGYRAVPLPISADGEPVADIDRCRVVAACVMKNEVENLAELHESAADLIDRWVILDTGSTDGTQDEARRLGMTVIEDPWRDDFAYSRNLVMDDARERFDPEWLVYLDGDDRVIHGAVWRAALLSRPEQPFCSVRVDSPMASGTVEASTQYRTLRASENIRFMYPAHAIPKLDRYVQPNGFGLENHAHNTTVLHIGYQTEAEVQNNIERTLRILREKMDPDHQHRRFYEARALAYLGEWADVAQIIKPLVVDRAPGGPRPIPPAFGIYAQALLNTADHSGPNHLRDMAHIAAVLVKGLHERSPNALDQWLMLKQVVHLGLYASLYTLAHGGAVQPGMTAQVAVKYLHEAALVGHIDVGEDIVRALEQRLVAAGLLAASSLPTPHQAPAASTLPPSTAVVWPGQAVPEARAANGGRVLAVIGAWKRESVLDVSDALQKQTRPPDKIVVWQHEAHIDIGGALDDLGVTHIQVNDNLHHAARFVAPYLFDVDYVVVHDDDCVPAPGWIDRAIDCIQRTGGIVGSEGRQVKVVENKVHQQGIFQPAQDTRVDFVGHAWAMTAEHAKLVWAEAPLDRTNGADDIHLGVMAARAGVPIHVPAATDDGNADVFKMQLGSDEHATWKQAGHFEKRIGLITDYIRAGWPTSLDWAAKGAKAGTMLEYRFARVEDASTAWQEVLQTLTDVPAWSRIAEYPWALTQLPETPGTLHNTSAGMRHVHHAFARALGEQSTGVVHSDIQPGLAERYNVLIPWDGTPATFDTVVNISTLEELPASQLVNALDHLWAQVAPGGRLILTFDYPWVNLEVLSGWTRARVDPTATSPRVPRGALSGANSPWSNERGHGMRVVFWSAQKAGERPPTQTLDRQIGSCGIYEDRPQNCRDYPQASDFRPPGCTYSFDLGVRAGSCQPTVCGENLCCGYPREGGEPAGLTSHPHAPGKAAGTACKHLVWVELGSQRKAARPATVAHHPV